MDKGFICLVPCKPYDNIEKVIEGIHELKNNCVHCCKIKALVAISDVGQLSHETKKNFPEISFGSFSIGSNGSSKFSQSVENQLFKDVEAEFVIVGDIGKVNADREELLILKEKVKSSARSGLPVMLHVFASESNSGDQLQDQLIESLQDLSEDERSRVSIVFHVDSSLPKLMNIHELQPIMDNCRVILEAIGGGEYAKSVKILLSIPKYAPEWLNLCLLGQFDGVCINPNILPKPNHFIAVVEEKSVNQEHPQKKIHAEELSTEIKEEKPTIKELKIDSRPLEDLYDKGQKKSFCLVYCHVFDDLVKMINRSREFVTKAQDSIDIDIECLFALPFGSLAQKPNLDGLNWGIWGHSMGQAGRLGDRVFLDLFKDQGASFIVIGDRLSREVLEQPSQGISPQIAQSLKEGILPIIGITSTQDLSSQIQESFQGLSPEDLSQMILVFYSGKYGHDIELEAKQIDQQVNFLRQIVEENYGKEVAKSIKILLEISHFSRDPFSYMMLKAVDGISISAQALKAEFLITKHALVETAKTVEEPATYEEELEKAQPSLEMSESPAKELESQEYRSIQTVEGEESSVAKKMPINDKVPEAVESVDDDGREFEAQKTAKIKETEPIADEEMEKWAEQHPETDSQTQTKIEYVQSGDKSESGLEEQQLQADILPQTQFEVKTVAEGINRVKLTVAECAEKLAENHFQQTYLPSETDLESPELKLERMKLEFKKKFEEFQNRCAKGWGVLFETMKNNQDSKREEIIQALNLPIEKIMEFTDLEKISEVFNRQSKKSWYEVIGLKKDQMGALYETARHLFENKKYTDAVDAFFTLVSMNANDYRYWFGYGMAKKLEKEDLDSALDSFSIANSLNPAAPEPFIHAAECYVEQGNFSEAKRCLTYGEQLLTEGDEYAYLKKWAKRLTEKIGGKNEF